MPTFSTATTTPTSRIHASQRSVATRSDTPRLHTCDRPARVLAQVGVLVLEVRPGRGPLVGAADVARGDERVSLQPAAVVARHVQSLVAAAQIVRFGPEPVDQRDVRLGARRRLDAAQAALDAPVPRADVLADVAAVHLGAEGLSILLRDRL